MPDFKTLIRNIHMLPAFAPLLLWVGLGLLVTLDAVRARSVAAKNTGYLGILVLLPAALYGAVYASFPSALVEAMPLWLSIGGLALLSWLLATYATVGMAACERFGINDMPLLRFAFERRTLPGVLFTRDYFIHVVLMAVVAPLLAVHVSNVIGLRLLTNLEDKYLFYYMGADPRLADGLLTAMGVVAGGVIATLGIQNWIARLPGIGLKRYWIAVGIAAVIAAGIPFRLDVASIFAFALVLPVMVARGLLFRRYGLETAIFAHGCFVALYYWMV